MNKGLLLLVLVPIIVLFLSVIVNTFELSKTTDLHDFSHCRTIKTNYTFEDIAVFEGHIIGGSADFISLFFKHLSAASAYPGKLVAVDIDSEKVTEVKIANFPTSLIFNPHGIKLHEANKLYVLSHSFANGGEVVVVLQLFLSEGEISAKFLKAIKIDNNHGIYNAISIVNQDFFYISQYIPFPDTLEGRDQSFVTDLQRYVFSDFIKTNAIYLCKVTEDSASCQSKYVGYMPNGLVISENLLFAADVGSKTIEVFQILDNLDLVKKATVQVNHITDNLVVSNGKVYVAGASKIIDIVKFSNKVKADSKPYPKVSGGVSEIYQENGKWVSKEILMQDLLSFPTACAVLGQRIVLSSLSDDSLLVCPLIPS